MEKKNTKSGLLLIAILFEGYLFGQVGIDTPTPSAALDIISKGNTATTKAFEINNSSGTEILTVLDDGKLGIGTSNPTYNLQAKGTIAFPDVAYNNLVSSYSALGINDNTGAIGILTPGGAQPLFVVGTPATSVALSSSSTGSANMDFGAAPILNTLGIISGQDTGLSLSDGSSSATVAYYQFSQAGTYKIEVTGTFKCTTISSTGNFLVNMNLWKAPNNTNYVIQDDYRIINLDGNLSSSSAAHPFSQSFIMNLAANDKIAFRFYKSSTGSTWSGCSMRLPSAGDQKYSMRLTITKL